MTDEFPGIASAETPSTHQRLFLRYFTAILIDLVVLNVFAEHWEQVVVDSFTLTVIAAILLQVLLKSTLALEHKISAYFRSQGGKSAKILRFFSAWTILFLSKFVMLGAINLTFGGSIRFEGPLHGVVAFIVVIFAMLAAEEAVVRLYRRLA